MGRYKSRKQTEKFFLFRKKQANTQKTTNVELGAESTPEKKTTKDPRSSLLESPHSSGWIQCLGPFIQKVRETQKENFVFLNEQTKNTTNKVVRQFYFVLWF